MSAIDKKDQKRIKSLMANFKKWSESRHQYLDFIIDETDMTKWWVRIRDLDGEFKGGEYIVHMFAPKDYPFGPPEFYFKTPNGVYGCDSKVCISIGEFHKKDFAAGQGGMGGFAAQLLNGMIFWKELGSGIAILNPEFHHAGKEAKARMAPALEAEKLRLAAASREANFKRFPDLARQFDTLPLNVAYRSVDDLSHSTRVKTLMKKYITPH